MRSKYILLALLVALQIASAIIVWWAGDKSEDHQIMATNVYMTFNALSWVFAFAIITMLSTGLFRQLAMIVCFLWVGNLVDELFFDPTIPQWNDVISLAIAENLALIAIVKNHLKK
jgi:hypothetical protein